MKILLMISLFLMATITHAGLKNSPHVFFENLKDGQTVEQEFVVKFGVKGMTLHPAGEVITGTGHHHLIINAESTPEGKAIAADATHLHFGKAQTETKLNLKPGDYTLTLQFANGAHISYGPKLSNTIKIHVK